MPTRTHRLIGVALLLGMAGCSGPRLPPDSPNMHVIWATPRERPPDSATEIDPLSPQPLAGLKSELILRDASLGDISAIRALRDSDGVMTGALIAGSRGCAKLGPDFKVESINAFSGYPNLEHTGLPFQIVDLDGDGEFEYVYSGGAIFVYDLLVFNADGRLRWSWRMPFRTEGFGMMDWVLPIPQSSGGHRLLVAGSNDNYGVMLDSQGREAGRIPLAHGLNWEHCLDIQDFTGDGVPDMVYVRGHPQTAAMCDLNGVTIGNFTSPDGSTLHVITRLRMSPDAAARGAVAQFHAMSHWPGLPFVGRGIDPTYLVTMFREEQGFRVEFQIETHRRSVSRFGDTPIRFGPDWEVLYFATGRRFYDLRLFSEDGHQFAPAPISFGTGSGRCGQLLSAGCAEACRPRGRTGDVLLAAIGDSVWAITAERSPAIISSLP